MLMEQLIKQSREVKEESEPQHVLPMQIFVERNGAVKVAILNERCDHEFIDWLLDVCVSGFDASAISLVHEAEFRGLEMDQMKQAMTPGDLLTDPGHIKTLDLAEKKDVLLLIGCEFIDTEPALTSVLLEWTHTGTAWVWKKPVVIAHNDANAKAQGFWTQAIETAMRNKTDHLERAIEDNPELRDEPDPRESFDESISRMLSDQGCTVALRS